MLRTESKGLEILIYKYEYLEDYNIYGCIGTKPYYEGDIWTKVLSYSEYEDYLLSSYDYLYVLNVNDGYNKDYGDLFEDGFAINDTMYIIEEETDGGICVKKVE